MGTAENKRSVIVGIFVFLGLIILVAGILTLGGKQKRFVKSIKVNAIFDDVAGLKVGNNVLFSGVKIGTVREIKFHGESQVAITMQIEEDAQRYIHKNAKVRLSSESLIGNKIIIIHGGTSKSPSVEDGDRLEAEKLLSTDEMMETLQENNRNLVAITNDLKNLSAKAVKGEGAIGALLADTTLEQDLRGMVSSLEEVSSNTMRASGALSKFTAKLNTEGGLANELLTDTSVFSQLKTSVSELQQTTSSAAEMTNNFNAASQKLTSDNNALGVMLNDEEFAERMKNTMVNLETSTQKLDENMEALQHNFLLRGFFKKRAKNEAKQNKNKAEVQQP